MNNHLIEAAFLVINMVMAWWHSRLIKMERPILHFWWAMAYVGCIGIAFWITRNPVVCAAGVLIRVVIFAPFLNLLRGEAFFYTNPRSGSVIDKWEGSLYMPIYIVSFIALVILQLFI